MQMQVHFWVKIWNLINQSINQSIIYLNQAEAHKNREDRQGSVRKITKLEKNSSKLELPNKNCMQLHTYMTSLFAEQPNLRLKLAAALCRTVLKLGSPSSTSIAVTLLNLE